MGVDYSGNFGIGVKIKKVKFTKEMLEDGIDCMTEYLEEISSETDLKLFRIVDTADEAIEHLNKFYAKYSLKPNF